MRLTLHTDYALRVMIYLAGNQGQLSSIGQIARAYAISHNPLMKIVHRLVKGGLVESVRGRNGGIRLAHPASEISVGTIVRHMEDGFEMANCAECSIASGCGLRGLLGQAVAAFLAVLDAASLADLNHDPDLLPGLWRLGNSERSDSGAELPARG